MYLSLLLFHRMINHERNKQNRSTGYMASSFRSLGTISLIKCTELYVDHTKAASTYTILIKMCTKDPISRLIIAAIFSGNRQQPSRHIDWKKEIDPPKSYPFIAITAPPSHTIQKTISKRRVLSSALVAILKMLASMRQKKKGPQRSQFLISFRFYSVSTYPKGFITILSFSQILSKSRL